MELIKKGNYIYVVEKMKLDTNGNKRFKVNVFKDTIHIKKYTTQSQNAEMAVNKYRSKNMKLQKYQLEKPNGTGEIFMATDFNQALQIAKAIYYVDMSEHWEYIAKTDGYIYTIDNINFEQGDNDYWIT